MLETYFWMQSLILILNQFPDFKFQKILPFNFRLIFFFFLKKDRFMETVSFYVVYHFRITNLTARTVHADR